jgi:hypothetical protein
MLDEEQRDRVKIEAELNQAKSLYDGLKQQNDIFKQLQAV